MRDQLVAASLAWLGIPAGSTGPDVDAAELVAAAVLGFVAEDNPGTAPLDTDAGAGDPGAGDGPLGIWTDAAESNGWPLTVALGAVMLAARLIRRRNSPAGIEAFATEGAAYVSRTDPDLARYLRIDRHAMPRLG